METQTWKERTLRGKHYQRCSLLSSFLDSKVVLSAGSLLQKKKKKWWGIFETEQRIRVTEMNEAIMKKLFEKLKPALKWNPYWVVHLI